jgi:hypothetical protein
MTRNGQTRVQRGALRVLRLTTQVMVWAFPRKVYRGERLANHDYRSATRVLERIAVRAGRARTSGGRSFGRRRADARAMSGAFWEAVRSPTCRETFRELTN